MSSLPTLRALLALSLTTSVVVAQTPDPAAKGQPEEKGAAESATPSDAQPKEKPDTSPAPEDASSEAEPTKETSNEDAKDEQSESGDSPNPNSSAGAEALPAKDATAKDEAPLPLLGEPTANEQEPPPVVVVQEPPKEPKVELSLYAGAQYRTPKGNALDYGAALAWGVRAGVYPVPWLAARAYARFAEIPVDVKPGGYDTERTQYPDTVFDQDNLDVFGLGFRLEPGPRLGRRFRVFAILDAAWTRFVAPAPKTRGAQSVRSAERRGVGVDYKFGAGASFEPIEGWMTISADGTYGFITRQTGTAFDDVLQGIDENGSVVHIATLPKFERSIEALLSIGLVL